MARRRIKGGLAAWIEANLRLPDTVAEPGPVKLWPWQREIADAISDPAYERVTMLKATRLGFSSLFTSAIGYYCVEKPSPIPYMLPTEARPTRLNALEKSPAIFSRLPDM
jgi:phage terminase large subunit GpA-like protein